MVATIDGGRKIITFVIDGVLCDGGDVREFGWGRFNRDLGNLNGSGELRIAPGLQGQLGSVRLYNRYLRTSEAVGNFQSGR